MSRATFGESDMSILQNKLPEFHERLAITGLVLLFASALGTVHQLSIHPAWSAASVLLISFIVIGIYRTCGTHRLRMARLRKDPMLAWFDARNTWQTRRRIKAIHHEVENRERRIVADLIKHLAVLDAMLWHQFPDLKVPFNMLTGSISVAIFEDDSSQLGSVVLMDVLSRLGFKVSAVESTPFSPSSYSPRLVLHFTSRQADVVLVGKKVGSESLNQYIAEVYPWKDTVRVVRADDAALADNVSRVFRDSLVPPNAYPPPFWNIVLEEIVIAMGFWAAQSDQRHHLFAAPDLPHERDPRPL